MAKRRLTAAKRRTKLRALRVIRSLKFRAATRRLKGDIEGATKLERRLDREFAVAESQGMSGAATRAEESGYEMARRAATRRGDY